MGSHLPVQLSVQLGQHSAKHAWTCSTSPQREQLSYHTLIHNGKLNVDFSKHSEDAMGGLEPRLASSASWAKSGRPLGFIRTGFIGTRSCPFVYGSSVDDPVLQQQS